MNLLGRFEESSMLALKASQMKRQVSAPEATFGLLAIIWVVDGLLVQAHVTLPCAPVVMIVIAALG